MRGGFSSLGCRREGVGFVGLRIRDGLDASLLGGLGQGWNLRGFGGVGGAMLYEEWRRCERGAPDCGEARANVRARTSLEDGERVAVQCRLAAAGNKAMAAGSRLPVSISLGMSFLLLCRDWNMITKLRCGQSRDEENASISSCDGLVLSRN